MKNREDFFITHQNKTKNKTNPCHHCTTETGRYPGCHDHCDKHIAWKEPDKPFNEEYIHERGNKRNLQKISGGKKA